MPNATNQVSGIVKWFSNEKGWGFISYEGKDYFAHHSDIIGKGFKTLIKEQAVKFEPKNGDKGCVAKNIIVDACLNAI